MRNVFFEGLPFIPQAASVGVRWLQHSWVYISVSANLSAKSAMVGERERALHSKNIVIPCGFHGSFDASLPT